MSRAYGLHRQMTCTRAEFMSWLPGATRHAPVRIDGNTVTIVVSGGSVRIALAERPPRPAGSMALPVLEISIRFIDLDDRVRDDFLAYFDLYTRRGGG